jgi:hypothetical protein
MRERLSGCRSAFLWLGPLFDAAVCDSVLIVAGEMQFPSPLFGVSGPCIEHRPTVSAAWTQPAGKSRGIGLVRLCL